MRTALFSFIWLAFAAFLPFKSSAQKAAPDTVEAGIYITSIHDIDFRQKEYSINLWLWLKYRRPEFDFMKNLEVPMAKSFTKSYATFDTLDDGRIYVLMKLECVMKGIWDIRGFPFDTQTIRFSLENSMYDASELIFKEDTLGDHYGKYFLVSWEKESFDIKTEIKKYNTAFGDPDIAEPHSEYSAYKVTAVIHRHSWELFLKLFIGMYISLMISCTCYLLAHDKIDSRLTLSVGSLFAVIGNKYIVDSSLPESNSFTLVDMLHGITLLYIFITIVYSIISFQSKKVQEIKHFDKIVGGILFLIYIIVNILLIRSAHGTVG